MSYTFRNAFVSDSSPVGTPPCLHLASYPLSHPPPKKEDGGDKQRAPWENARLKGLGCRLGGRGASGRRPAAEKGGGGRSQEGVDSREGGGARKGQPPPQSTCPLTTNPQSCPLPSHEGIQAVLMSTFDFSTFSGSTLTRQPKFTAHLPCAGARHLPEPSKSLPHRPSDRGTLLSTLVTMSAGRPPMIPSAPVGPHSRAEAPGTRATRSSIKSEGQAEDSECGLLLNTTSERGL